MEKRLRMGDPSRFRHVFWSCGSSSRLCPSSVLCAGQATQPRARAFSAGPDTFVWSACRHLSLIQITFKLARNWGKFGAVLGKWRAMSIFGRWESVQNLPEYWVSTLKVKDGVMLCLLPSENANYASECSVALWSVERMEVYQSLTYSLSKDWMVYPKPSVDTYINQICAIILGILNFRRLFKNPV